MKNRVIEISTDGIELSKNRGFLLVSTPTIKSQIPLADIGVLLITGRSVTYTNSLLLALAEDGITVVICNDRFLPVAWLWPLSGHHTQSRHINAQICSSKPVSKRMWQEIVRSKIQQQASVVAFIGGSDKPLIQLMKLVRSGDPGNVEAQAARMYWPILFGKAFRRNRLSQDVNMFLNYGYTVLRAATARAVVSSGLHPSIGIHHSNQYNDFRLVDDLTEPFRPLIDVAVHRLSKNGEVELNTSNKRFLALLVSRDLSSTHGTSPIFNCILRLAQSVAKSFLDEQVQLDLPNPCTPLELEGMTRE